MDSPLAKIIDFLQRYQRRSFPFGLTLRPSAHEAAELERLIFRQSGSLDAPDIRRQLLMDPTLQPELVKHILCQFTEGDERSRTRNTDSSADDFLVDR
eukprot:scaffold177603_cov31-Prasinocladus_malaysianus.AAC.1